jgi:hypothetical protein
VSEQEYLYIQSPLTLAAEAEQLADILGLEMRADARDVSEPIEFELTGAARVSDARALLLSVELNDRAMPDAPADWASAADGYAYEVYVQAFGTSEAQAREARAIFDELIKQRPDTPMLLTHEGIHLTAAYLPDAGVHDFSPGIEADMRHKSSWAAWVVSSPPSP